MSTFVDEANIEVTAGKGGRGASSFRREKYVPNGGPDGGDGGRGGDVVLKASTSESTLYAFRRKHRFLAKVGGDGSGGKRSGKHGGDTVITVPPGTIVRCDGEVLADLTRDGDKVVAARGGRGGRGNARFASSTHQAPRHAELGDPGETRVLELELRLIADVGLVGLPNAGKSSLLGAWTRANPKVGAYPFTTLSPNLGVAEVGEGRTMVVADVPGLIEGAHEGVGLGTEFLRHIERTRVLVHVVDASLGESEVRTAVETIRHELGEFDAGLLERDTILVFNKIDVPEGRRCAELLLTEYEHALAISAATGENCQAALTAAAKVVFARRPQADAVAPVIESHHLYKFYGDDQAPVINRDASGFHIRAPRIEKVVRRTDVENEESLGRLMRIFRKSGVDAALRAAGCEDGDTVFIGPVEFTYFNDMAAADG
jgi:GTP-binding protein